jgi:type IV secretion system protein VirD4
MNKQNNKLTAVLVWAAVFAFAMWLAVVLAGEWQNGIGIFEYIERLSETGNPFALNFNKHTLRFMFIFAGLYGLMVSAYYANRLKKREGEEHGSAVWGNANQVNKQFSQDKKTDIILTQNVRLGLDTHKHRRNLNVLVVGGSGAGKSRFYVRPNIMQLNTSFVVTDPKSELLKSTGHLLKKKGYEIKVLNLVNFGESDSYNPFMYIRDDKDVIKLINNLIANTTPKSARESDPFWTKAETALLQALMFYLVYEAPKYEQNFSMIMTMLEYAGASEEDENMESALDMLFGKLELTNPTHIALKQYKVFKKAAGKTAKSILVSCAVRLAAFNLKQIKNITNHDEMDIANLARKKTAIFAVVPDNDSSFNYIIGMLYTQVFQEMYYQADHVHGGMLPIPLHVCMDEFSNIALPDEFDKVLSTMRSRGISASIILQNLAQLKGLFKASQSAWETIVGNCDSFLYLGGNEKSTHDYVSKLLGKSTINLKTHNRTKGRSGSFTTNYQLSGRELLTPDEVRLLDNEYAVLFIRGAKPVMDKKYNLLSHPNIALTTDGNEMPYIHNDGIKTVDLVDAIDLNRAEEYQLID